MQFLLDYIPNDIEYKTSLESKTTETNSLPFKSSEILEKVMADRVSFLKKSIDEINLQIVERQCLSDHLKCGIDKNLCRIQTDLYQIDPLGKMTLDRCAELESEIIRLYQELRQEKVDKWKDILLLKNQLRDTENELRKAQMVILLLNFL